MEAQEALQSQWFLLLSGPASWVMVSRRDWAGCCWGIHKIHDRDEANYKIGFCAVLFHHAFHWFWGFCWCLNTFWFCLFLRSSVLQQLLCDAALGLMSRWPLTIAALIFVAHPKCSCPAPCLICVFSLACSSFSLVLPLRCFPSSRIQSKIFLFQSLGCCFLFPIPSVLTLVFIIYLAPLDLISETLWFHLDCFFLSLFATFIFFTVFSWAVHLFPWH